ncbi:TetR/AcrR family transcriptional regulator [Streptomyces katsurahamanus]|uniref:TetR/AcrR family transcriptional regulator n=1 Tax=Streptomyces katsurahamanus TaxID=2577098 RepID=A0ABW9P1T6_9ACTN|nr:TetR/AcrR family transcriptional regulator C-terminal domain-containing protein [Streptomyces katsurahamanus]MQS39460.1 TetR/AcrR family transcriptional regulator [Streptomyces katsurahamanus]
MVSAADRAKSPARTSVWLEGKAERGRRSAQPASLDRAKIIDATVRLLDSEGAAKFSMRRLAAELDVTAMSVYWYVDTKDDLLELALDAAFGTIRLPDAGADALPDGDADAGDWRGRLRRLAVDYRALLVRHPWVSPLVGTFLNIGPNALAFSLAIQQVMRDTGLPPRGQMGALSAVFQFVYGFGTIEGHFIARCASAGMSQDEYYREAIGTMTGAPDLGLKKYITESMEIMVSGGTGTVAEMRERDFEYALETLVAGIEAMAARG